MGRKKIISTCRCKKGKATCSGAHLNFTWCLQPGTKHTGQDMALCHIRDTFILLETAQVFFKIIQNQTTYLRDMFVEKHLQTRTVLVRIYSALMKVIFL